MLKARAEEAYFVEEGKDELTELKATTDTPIEIPCETWSRSVNWEADRLGWDWHEGEFDIEGQFAEDEVTFIGVTLLKSDIDDIQPDKASFEALLERRLPRSEVVKEVRTARSEGARTWDWESAFADLVAEADFNSLEDNFGPFKRGFQGNLEEWFAKYFQSRLDSAPSEDPCRRRARMVVQAMERVRGIRD